MRKLGFIIGVIVLFIAVMPVNDNSPVQAVGLPVPQEAPRLPPTYTSPFKVAIVSSQAMVIGLPSLKRGRYFPDEKDRL